jgi:acyl carrier protein
MPVDVNTTETSRRRTGLDSDQALMLVVALVALLGVVVLFAIGA